MSKSVRRFRVPADGELHLIGGGPVVELSTLGTSGIVFIWTEEKGYDEEPYPWRMVKVVTDVHNREVPDHAVHLGMAIDPNMDDWHVYDFGQPQPWDQYQIEIPA